MLVVVNTAEMVGSAAARVGARLGGPWGVSARAPAVPDGFGHEPTPPEGERGGGAITLGAACLGERLGPR